MTLITIAALKAAGASQARAEKLLDPMKLGAAIYGIDSPLRIAHFLAQLGHESGGFVHTKEVWGPTAQQNRYDRDPDAPWPSSLAESKLPKFYRNKLAWNLGNDVPGDGPRYPGRSYGQTTGKANYCAVRDRLRQRFDNVPDFEIDPQRLEEMPWCVLAAFDFWDMKHLAPLADADEFVTITHRWNGGENGIDDRRRRLQAIKHVLANEAPAPEPIVPPPAFAIPPNPWATDPAPPAVVAPLAAFPDDALIEAALAPQPEKPMIPMLIPLVLQGLSALVPQLGTIFGSGSEVSQRNLKAAEVVIAAAKSAAGAVNEQELLEKIEAGDPAIVAAVTEAVKTVYFEVVEAGGGGIAAARKMNEAAGAMPGGAGFATPAFGMAMALLPLVYMTVWYVLTGEFASEVKSMVVSLVVGGVIGAVTAFFFGSSFSSQRKDERGR
jgi:putative chitinase